MNEANAAEWLGAWGSFLGAIAALGAVGLAARQLRGLIKQLKQGSFVALLTLEIEMNERKQKVEDATREIRRLGREEKSFEEISIAYEYLEGCVENWLNLADRLAFCLRKNILREKDYKSEYLRYFQKLVSCNPQYFGDDTIYDNIVYICRRWHIHIPKPSEECSPSPVNE